MQIALGKQLP